MWISKHCVFAITQILKDLRRDLVGEASDAFIVFFSQLSGGRRSGRVLLDLICGS